MQRQPQLLFVPVLVIERPVWALSKEHRQRVGVTVCKRTVGFFEYEEFFLGGEPIDPNTLVLVPVEPWKV